LIYFKKETADYFGEIFILMVDRGNVQVPEIAVQTGE